MKLDEFVNLSKQIDQISKNSMIEIASIIENECKQVAEKYGVSADKMSIQLLPMSDNTTRYKISIVLSEFVIETTYSFKSNEEDKK